MPPNQPGKSLRTKPSETAHSLAGKGHKLWTWWLGILAVLVCTAYLLSPILSPFIAGMILAYILHPGVQWLANRKVPKSLAVALMLGFLLIITLLIALLILPVVQREAMLIQQKIPLFLNALNEFVAPKLKEWFGLRIRFDPASVKKYFTQQWINNAEDLMPLLADFTRSQLGGFLQTIATLVLTPLVTYYFLMDWQHLWRRVLILIPKRQQRGIHQASQEVDHLLAQYLRGQLAVMAILAVFYTLALSLVGLDVALPVGILTGMLIFIPYIGFSLGMIIALLAAALQFHNLAGIAYVALIFGIGQVIESAFLTPRLVGERIGLHPLAVIFVLLAFGQLFGFTGVLLALPISAAGMVAISRLIQRYLASRIYNG